MRVLIYTLIFTISMFGARLSFSAQSWPTESMGASRSAVTAVTQRAVTTTAVTMTLEQAIAMVQSKYRARVMRANSVEEDGRTIHYIRLITADRSRVWTVRVDAATGQEF